ncbi:MAG: hypothetical protein JSS49_29900 [Planctomycetes bacterium]|nr:hypothetical protein [Planctomycetota bacterium]
MSSEDDRFWSKHAKQLQRKKGFARLTPEEAEAAFSAAQPVDLSDDRVESIVEYVVSSGSDDIDEGDGWTDDSHLERVEDESMQLCRHGNEESSDDDIDQIEQDLEDKLLQEDDADEEDET